MPRKRTISPGFFKSDELAKLPPLTRIFFAGLWCWADRNGLLEDRPLKLKGEIMPYDACDGEQMLSALAAAGHIRRFEHAGMKLVWITKFATHQTNLHPAEQAVLPVAEWLKTACFPPTQEQKPPAGQPGSGQKPPANHLLYHAGNGTKPPASNALTSLSSLSSCTSPPPGEGPRPKSHKRKTQKDLEAEIAASLGDSP